MAMKTQRVQCFATVVLFLSLFVDIAAHAQITPIGDAYTNSATPTTNYGAKTLLDVDAASQISYIQFDLGSIPSGASVIQATLKLYVNSVTTAGGFNVDYVNGSWSEGTIDYSNAPSLGSSIASGIEITTAEKNHYVLINVTPALVAWLNGSQANDGIALVANGSFNATFDSKENTTTSHPPELDVVFAGGGGGTITGVLTGAGSGLTGGGTSGTLNLSLLNTCAASQVLQWNGSGWACASVGAGTITGVTAGTDLTGGGNSGSITLNLDTTKVPQLAAANTFTGSQTVNGNLSATGLVTGSGFQIGSNLFNYGSYGNLNAFLGFAGNTSMTGGNNTAAGIYALSANTTGNENTATGAYALSFNNTGASNNADGWAALYLNTTGSYNTAMGTNALYSNTTGGYNTASGDYALGSNTTASYNTADGSAALYSNTTGSYDTAEGTWALYLNTTGHDNTANGYGALYSNTTGIYNTADGSGALGQNSTGAQNTAVGWSALGNTTGYNNTASGWDSGYTLDSSGITGANNTFLGAATGLSTGNLTNATAIGAHAEVDESNALVLGSINGVNGATANTNVGIGTTKPAAALDVHGTGNFTGLITFAPGQTFPGTGTITGVTAGTALTGGGGSGNVTLNVDTTKVVTGVLAGMDLTGGGMGGVQTLNLDTTKVPLLVANNNFAGNQMVTGNLGATGVVTGSGYQIQSNLFDYGSYGNSNAYLGFAGNGTITGDHNTASGVAALFSNSTGSQNTASGAYALESNTTGIWNTASGLNALRSNTTGGGNTASGLGALYRNTTGGVNTASGMNSGLTVDFSYISGSFDTFMGYDSGLSTGTLINATAIGAFAEVAASNAMVLGSINGVNGATADTMVGIGTTAPTSLLHIGNSGGTTNLKNYLRIEGPLNQGSGIPAFSVGGNGIFGIDAPGFVNQRFFVNEYPQNGVGGLVGINTPSPDATLSVNGTADKPGGGSWGTPSDGRLKNVDGSFHSGLEQVLKLRPVRYRYKADNALGISDHEEHVGVVAQEVQRVLPEAVSENNRGYLLVNNDPIIWAMLNAIKEQQKEIKALRKRAVRLESKLKELQTQRGQVEVASVK
jgi:hypothetical protein